MNLFRLDARLASDSLELGAFGLCQVRLMNDARWPWLVLVPMVADAGEMHDLPKKQQRQLAEEVFLTGAALKRVTGCEKINTAAIGNIVPQLHVHVIARGTGDANWPGPVWGFGARQEYQVTDLTFLINNIRRELSTNFL